MALRVTRENLVPLPATVPYFLFGLASFVIAGIALAAAAQPVGAGAYRHPHLLAAVHLYVLGWATAIALGALQQMVPVVFNTELRSTRLSWAVFPVFAAGVAALVWSLFTMAPAGFAVSVLIPVAAAAILANLALTLRTAQQTRQGRVIKPFVFSALVYLTLTLLAGVALGFNFRTGWLGAQWSAVFPIHIALGLGGWLLMLIVGISYHLMPFFGLVHKKFESRWRRIVHIGLHAVVWLGAAGAAAGLQGAPAGKWAASASAGIAGACCLLFLWETKELYKRRSQERMHPLVGYIRAAHAYLAALALGLLGLAFGAGARPQLLMALGLLAMPGWLSNTVLGYMHRIVPFIAWHNKYWGRGREPGVPAFRSMIHGPWAWAALAVYNAGLLAALASLFTPLQPQWGLGMMAAGGALAAGNLARAIIR